MDNIILKIDNAQSDIVHVQKSTIDWSINCCLKATREKSAEQMAADVRELLGGESPDVTIECSGVEASVR